jgi:flagellar hook assembly protein FlgD
LLRQIERYNISANEGFVKVEWDGRDQDGDKVANGTYLYKIIVNSIDGQHSRSALGKLAIIK